MTYEDYRDTRAAFETMPKKEGVQAYVNWLAMSFTIGETNKDEIKAFNARYNSEKKAGII